MVSVVTVASVLAPPPANETPILRLAATAAAEELATIVAASIAWMERSPPLVLTVDDFT